LIRKIGLTVALCVVAALALAACGSSSDTTSSSSTPAATTDTSSSGGGGGGATVDVAADPSGALAFTETKLSTTAGSDTINFTNDSSTPHNVTIEDQNANDVGATDTITGSSTSTTVDLKPGTYKFYCSVDGHEAAGMEGELTVK
jgi:plastocyanin